jgi:hypothetical protein
VVEKSFNTQHLAISEKSVYEPDGSGQRKRPGLLRHIPHHLGKPNGHHHQLLHQPFIERLGEGLNNKIKVLKRRSYGIKNLGNLFRRIWLDLRDHEAFAH